MVKAKPLKQHNTKKIIATTKDKKEITTQKTLENATKKSSVRLNNFLISSQYTKKQKNHKLLINTSDVRRIFRRVKLNKNCR